MELSSEPGNDLRLLAIARLIEERLNVRSHLHVQTISS
jgi:hypothetical protein